MCSHTSNHNRFSCVTTNNYHTPSTHHSLLQDHYFVRAEKFEVKPKEDTDKEDGKKVSKDETLQGAEKTKSGKQGNKNKGQTTPDSPQTSKEVCLSLLLICVCGVCVCVFAWFCYK